MKVEFYSAGYLLGMVMWLGFISCGCSETNFVSSWDFVGHILDDDVDGGSRQTEADMAVCVPACDGKECGEDGCGGFCGECPDGVACTDFVCAGVCEDDCSAGEKSCTVGGGYRLCGHFDADGCMDWSETQYCPGAGECVDGECVCTPSCDGKECGYDGCSGSCGTCADGNSCSKYKCIAGCVDECEPPGKGMCSGNGRVVCGQFDSDDCLEWSEPLACSGECVDGECFCIPDCAGKECGVDGCGGTCGTCQPGLTCKNYVCVEGPSAECLPGEGEEVDCGLCGKQMRSCSADGIWGAWSECVGEGLCSPGENQSEPCGTCGSKTRTCNGGCQWDPWGSCAGEGLCSPGQVESQPCGNCGTETRTCNGNCQWDPWGGCSGEGICWPGDSESQPCGLCGSETRSCDGNCTWGPWGSCTGQGQCSPGEMQSQPCGNCGNQSRSCGGNCQWSNWGGCTGQGQCSPGQSEGCGACGTMACGAGCQWGPCSGEGVCSPGQTSSDGCNNSCQVKQCGGNCQWPDACTGCSCNSYYKCGSSCPSGYHVSKKQCDYSNCGNSCYSYNEVQCQQD